MGWNHHLCDIYDSVLQRHAVALVVLSQAKENYQVRLLDDTRSYCPVSLVYLYNDGSSRKS